MNKRYEKLLINPIDKIEPTGLVNPIEVINPIEIIGGKSPENKLYIVLFYETIDDSDPKQYFEMITGREDTYIFIKDLIIGSDIDIHESRVLVEGVDITDSISIYNFMKHMEIYFKDGFDIEDFNDADIENEEEDIEPNINPNNYIYSEDVELWKSVQKNNNDIMNTVLINDDDDDDSNNI